MRGGKRQGSGRKKAIIPKKVYSYRLTEKENKLVDEYIERLKKMKDKIKEMMTEYVSGIEIYKEAEELFGEKADEVTELFALYDRAFDNLECDPEGYNSKQEKADEELLEKYAIEILKILEK